ncbi:hypothetical protein Cgig2_003510 [Carnegiea gigantea]|uniref:Uncharacterized protein n=1 Tax=Carnegiea gigantea TaxID=171969 RepID=A0A9Q1GH71_9CARY|nr:hypothetical protein Cgig2_003510 [Carnegiea gigantea]
MATIAGSYVEEITRSTWKAQLRGTQQPNGAYDGIRGEGPPRFASHHNDPLVVEMKIASAIVRQFLVNTGSSVDIITWDFMNRLAHPGRDIVPMANPILGFGGQEVHPTGMICLLVRFGDKTTFKSLEVDFLIVDVPTAYNIIIGRPTLHRAPTRLLRKFAPAHIDWRPSRAAPSHGRGIAAI